MIAEFNSQNDYFSLYIHIVQVALLKHLIFQESTIRYVLRIIINIMAYRHALIYLMKKMAKFSCLSI